MQENVKLALQALDYLEKKHLECAKEMKVNILDWDTDGPRKLGLKIAENHEQYAKNMADIKEILRKPKRSKVGSDKSK